MSRRERVPTLAPWAVAFAERDRERARAIARDPELAREWPELLGAARRRLRARFLRDVVALLVGVLFLVGFLALGVLDIARRGELDLGVRPEAARGPSSCAAWCERQGERFVAFQAGEGRAWCACSTVALEYVARGSR